MNTLAIADAIAARFLGVTATLNGKTESIAIGPTARLPNSLSKGPALLVYHPSGPLEIGVSRRRTDHLDFPVRLLRDPLDVPLRSAWLYAWYDAIRDRVERLPTLGLSYVAKATPVAMRAEIDGQPYGLNTSTFDVVELIVRVLVFEVVATVGIEG